MLFFEISTMKIFERFRFIILLKVLAIGLPSSKTETNQKNGQNSVTVRKTQILYSNIFNETWLRTRDKVVNLASTDYIRLATEGAFVDKSMLIKVVFEDYGDVKCMLVVHPRRWGKTTNLQMIGHFAEAELDDDYNRSVIKDYKETRAYEMFVNGVFTPVTNENNPTKHHFVGNKKLLISNEVNEPVIKNHLGRYVVIELIFFCTISHSCTDPYICFLEDFKLKIRSIYNKFTYVQDKLDEGEKADFQAILNGRETVVSKWQSSIINLCRYLRYYFSMNRDSPINHEMPKILILIDEYDFPFNELFFSSRVVKDQKFKNDIIDFMRVFVLKTFRDQNHLYDKAILTGISRLAKASGFTAVHNFQMCSATEHDLYPFYGFTEDEVSDLLEIRGKRNELDNVKKWYDGYRTISNLKAPIFNPISVLSYLPKSITNPYWMMTGSKLIYCFGKMLKHYQIFLKFRELLNAKGMVLIKTSRLNPSVEEINMISLITHGENLTTFLSDSYVDAAFVILFSCGYLGLSEDQPPVQSKTISLRIPNREIRQFWLEAYEWDRFTISRRGDILRNTVGTDLQKYLWNHNEETFRLCRNSIQEMFKNSGPYTDDMQTFLKNVRSEYPKNFIVYKLGFLNDNEAMAHFLMMEALMTLQKIGSITLGSEVTFSYYSPFKKGNYEYRMDLFAFNEENVTIIEMKADSKVKMVDVLFQAEMYLLFFNESLVSTFSYYKLVAVNFHDRDNVLVEHKVFHREEVKQRIEEWKNYEKTAKEDYETGTNNKWADLSVTQAKDCIIAFAEKSRRIRKPQILKHMPENLQCDPLTWSKEHCSEFIKFFAQHNKMEPPEENSVLFTLTGDALCDHSEIYLDKYFPTNGKLSSVLKSLRNYFEEQRQQSLKNPIDNLNRKVTLWNTIVKIFDDKNTYCKIMKWNDDEKIFTIISFDQLWGLWKPGVDLPKNVKLSIKSTLRTLEKRKLIKSMEDNKYQLLVPVDDTYRNLENDEQLEELCPVTKKNETNKS